MHYDFFNCFVSIVPFYWAIGLELNELSFIGRESIVPCSTRGDLITYLQTLITQQKLPKRPSPDLTLVRAKRAARVHLGKEREMPKLMPTCYSDHLPFTLLMKEGSQALKGVRRSNAQSPTLAVYHSQYSQPGEGGHHTPCKATWGLHQMAE